MRAFSCLTAVAMIAAPVAAFARPQPVADATTTSTTTPPRIVARNIVLIHGAWADGSSWSKVIPLLQQAGLRVTSVQNSLSTLADAKADVRRAIAVQDGPTVLVGHSWSGTLVSDVGVDAKVSALVYVAARAPAAGEDFLALQATFPNTPARAGIVNVGGLTTLSQSAFLNYFANGLPRREAMTLFAVQQPTAASLFAERTTATGWLVKPTYYAVSRNDMTINPAFERFLAKRMNATTVELDAGHLSMVSKPREVADLIIRAARSL